MLFFKMVNWSFIVFFFLLKCIIIQNSERYIQNVTNTHLNKKVSFI